MVSEEQQLHQVLPPFSVLDKLLDRRIMISTNQAYDWYDQQAYLGSTAAFNHETVDIPAENGPTLL